MAAIYLHIPFCKRLCGYCDFFKSVKLDHLGAVLDAMEQELEQERDYLPTTKIDTIYFGGGTPSIVPSERIATFMQRIAELYDVSNLREVTLEANPDDITSEYLAAIRKAGVNRLSIGIQSFDDQALRFMNRRHSAQQAIDAVKMAQAAGFDNITIDLIFGVDGFGEPSLRHSIESALSLGVQHISAYHLTIEPNTLFARRVARQEFAAVDESVSESEYLLLNKELCAAGYEHYEISNYALDGYRSQHNSSYWRGVPYLGIGPGAHSFDGENRRANISSIENYLEGGAARYEVEQLDQTDHYNEYVMTSLRCCEGVDLERVRREFSEEIYLYLLQQAESWIKKGVVSIEESRRLFIPVEHFLLSDAVIESLFLFK